MGGRSDAGVDGGVRGGALLQAIEHLIKFAGARNATTSAQLDAAGEEFAKAVAEIEVDALLLLITHRIGGSAKGGVPYEGPPPRALALATGPGGFAVPVVVSTIPAAQAAGLGVLGARATSVMMSGRGSETGPRTRDFEPPLRDATGKIHSEPGRDIPRTAEERADAVDSWNRDELEAAADELEQSIAARQAEQARLGETNVSATGVPTGAQHRVRIADGPALLRAIRKKLSGS